MRTASSEVRDSSLAGVRLDVFIADHMKLFSRSQARTRVAEAQVNGRRVRLSHKLRLGDMVSVDYTEQVGPDVVAEDIPLSILFENDDAIVIDKPQGMVVHPGSGNAHGTMVNALLFHCSQLGEAFGQETARPGIVHRLDKETSGVIIAAKNPIAHEYLSAQFKSREVRKRYLAITVGTLPAAAGRIETRIVRDPVHRKRFTISAGRGRLAITHYKVIRVFTAMRTRDERGQSFSLVALMPRTGRTHQLRVHMRHLSTPILGDPLYGKPHPLFPDCGLLLHARGLTIRLPGEDHARTFAAAVPERFKSVLRELHNLSPR